MADGHYGFGRPVGSPEDIDEYLSWCSERRRAYAAGEVPPKPPKLFKMAGNHEIIEKTPDTPAGGPSEDGHPSTE